MNARSEARISTLASTIGTWMHERGWNGGDPGLLTDWPPALHSALQVLLACPAPMLLICGAERVALYNDAFSRLIGDAHPRLIGASLLEAWPECAARHSEALNAVFAGRPSPHRDFGIPDGGNTGALRRVPAEYSPIYDAAGAVVAAIIAFPEPTAPQRAFGLGGGADEWQRVIGEQSVAGVIQTDLTDRLLFANQEFCRVLRAACPELLGRSIHDFIHPEDREAYSRALERARIQRAAVEIEMRLRRENEAPAWIRSSIAARRRQDGTLHSIVATVVEITAWKQMEAALRANDTHMEAIFTHATVGLSEISLEGQFLRVNDELCRMLGRPREELLAMGVPEVTHPDDLPKSLTAVGQLIETGTRVSLDKRYRRPDGVLIWANSSLTRLDHPDGRPRSLLAVTVDLTERHRAVEVAREARDLLEQRVIERTALLTHEIHVRKRAEEALGEINRTLQALINACPLAITAVTRSGLVAMWNPAAERLFGWKADEVLNRPPPQLPEIDRERYAKELAVMVEAGERWNGFETRRRRKDGRVFDASIWSAPLHNARGERTASMLLIADITERRRLEQSLLDASEHEQRRLGASLHDGLCQSLAGTSLLAHALASGMKAAGDEKSEDVQNLSDVLLKIVDEAQAIAHGLHPAELDVGGLSAALEGLAAQTARTVDCDFDCPYPVALQPREKSLHLYRIAQEAVHNAVRHGNANRIVLSLRSDVEGVILEIRDNGKGFVPETIDAAKSMGLATMRYRANAMGATLTIQSSRGRGVRVRCRVPAGE